MPAHRIHAGAFDVLGARDQSPTYIEDVVTPVKSRSITKSCTLRRHYRLRCT